MDSDWITNSQHLYSNNANLFKTTQPSIKSLFIYINTDNNIDQVVSNVTDISHNTISNHHLLKIILKNKISTPQYVYNFDALSLFSIPFEHDKINLFNSPQFIIDHSFFIHNLSINSQLSIPTSLPIFHKFNTLIFFYKKRIIEAIPKSILVTPHKKSLNPKKTKKKVQIVEHKFRKTKKAI